MKPSHNRNWCEAPWSGQRVGRSPGRVGEYHLERIAAILVGRLPVALADPSRCALIERRDFLAEFE